MQQKQLQCNIQASKQKCFSSDTAPSQERNLMSPPFLSKKNPNFSQETTLLNWEKAYKNPL